MWSEKKRAASQTTVHLVHNVVQEVVQGSRAARLYIAVAPQITRIILKRRAVPIGKVLNLRTTT